MNGLIGGWMKGLVGELMDISRNGQDDVRKI